MARSAIAKISLRIITNAIEGVESNLLSINWNFSVSIMSFWSSALDFLSGTISIASFGNTLTKGSSNRVVITLNAVWNIAIWLAIEPLKVPDIQVKKVVNLSKIKNTIKNKNEPIQLKSK